MCDRILAQFEASVCVTCLERKCHENLYDVCGCCSVRCYVNSLLSPRCVCLGLRLLLSVDYVSFEILLNINVVMKRRNGN